MEKEESQKGGCVKLLLAGLGFILILSPVNPFVEWKNVGEDERLTNSSWLVVSLMLLAYLYFIMKWLSNKK